MTSAMKVDVHPILRMEVRVDDFGKLFARMNSNEQVAVLRAMVAHMRPHPLQWDYIALELEELENVSLRQTLHDIFAIKE